LTLLGAGADSTFIEGVGSPGGGYTLTLTAADATVDGFTIRNASSGDKNSIAVAWGYQGSGSTLTNSRVEGHITGIYLSSGIDGATIEHNTITGNANGILFEGREDNVRVEHNQIVDNTMDDTFWPADRRHAGVRLLDTYSGTGNVITCNTFSGNGVGVHNASTTLIDARGNDWGSPTGPSAPSNPSGTGERVIGPVDVFPWVSANTLFYADASGNRLSVDTATGNYTLTYQEGSTVKTITGTGARIQNGVLKIHDQASDGQKVDVSSTAGGPLTLDLRGKSRRTFVLGALANPVC